MINVLGKLALTAATSIALITHLELAFAATPGSACTVEKRALATGVVTIHEGTVSNDGAICETGGHTPPIGCNASIHIAQSTYRGQCPS